MFHPLLKFVPQSSFMSSAHTAQGTALKDWCYRNNVVMPTTADEHFIPDTSISSRLVKEHPWSDNVHYFTRCYVSALALLKMMMHAKSGHGKEGIIGTKDNWIEVMGSLQGHFAANCIVVTDSFALPVKASEVECSLGEEGSVYKVAYEQDCIALGKPTRDVAWYHSHPGYSCFLSGRDVNTQKALQSQLVLEPSIAFVIDPIRSLATGRVDVKAFRTYPADYNPTDSDKKAANELRARAAEGVVGDGGFNDESDVREDKRRDAGKYFDRYYEIPITVFRSTNDAAALDRMWSLYWAQSFTSNPLSDARVFHNRRFDSLVQRFSVNQQARKEEDALSKYLEGDTVSGFAKKTAQLNTKVAIDVLRGLYVTNTKRKLFSPQ